MQVTTTDIRRAVAGKDVLGILAFMLLVSGMTSSSVFVHVGEMLASAAMHLAPSVAVHVTTGLILLGIYLQAAVLAALYRTASNVYEVLQRRAERTGSA